jgi:hypothetical protein
MWQVSGCGPTVVPVPAQPLSLAGKATATLVFNIYLTSDAAATLTCTLGVVDSQVRLWLRRCCIA